MDIQITIEKERLKRLQSRLNVISQAGQQNQLLKRILDVTAKQTRSRLDKILAGLYKLKKKDLKQRKTNPIKFVFEQSQNSAKITIIMGGTGVNLIRYPHKEIKIKRHLIHFYIQKSNSWVSQWSTRGGISVKNSGKKEIFPQGFELIGRGGNPLLFERIGYTGNLKQQIQPLRTNTPAQILRESGKTEELYSYAQKRLQMNIAPAVRCIVAKISGQNAAGCF